MGFRLRKTIKIGPARLNISNTGIGWNVGTKGTGISYSSRSSRKKRKNAEKALWGLLGIPVALGLMIGMCTPEAEQSSNAPDPIESETAIVEIANKKQDDTAEPELSAIEVPMVVTTTKEEQAVIDETFSADTEEVPVIKETAPVVEETAPVAEEQAPVIEEVPIFIEEEAPVEETSPVPEAETPIAEQSEVVYITETGSKYHRSGCRHLKDSKIEIQKDTAISQGYEPCKTCH